MSEASVTQETIDQRIAHQLHTLRSDRGWTLDELAARSDVSRATLSRLENAEVSPTAAVMGKLCAAHQITMSRLMLMVEDDFAPHWPRLEQPLWRDPETGFERRSVSPPGRPLAGEVIECRLPAAARISYDLPPRPGLEHHLVMLSGGLAISVDGRTHKLVAGDCLRYQLYGASIFEADVQAGASYFLFIV